jgi:uncharacterized protein (DUF58 family)
VAVTTLISSVGGPPIFLSLGFSLAVLAAASLVLARSGGASSVRLEPEKVRCFKHEKVPVTLRQGGIGSRWGGPRELSLLTPYGLSCSPAGSGTTADGVVLEPSMAGLFDNLSLKLRSNDLLGLAVREELVPLRGFVLESLPVSLRTPAPSVTVSPLTIGDNPAGRRGGGQELYAVEQYHTSLDARDVLWKRVASSPLEELVSRTREANLPREVTVGVLLGWSSDIQRAKLLDLASEAVAQVGKTLLGLGATVRVAFLAGGRAVSTTASDVGALATAVLELSRMDNLGLGGLPHLPKFDLLVSELNDFRNGPPRPRGAPVLLLSESQAWADPRSNLAVFTGREDLSTLTARVLEG